MPDKSSSVPSSTVYSYTGVESLRTAKASNNSDSFSTAFKPLIACMSKQGVLNEKINSVILKFFNKDHEYFSHTCQSKQEMLDFVS